MGLGLWLPGSPRTGAPSAAALAPPQPREAHGRDLPQGPCQITASCLCPVTSWHCPWVVDQSLASWTVAPQGRRAASPVPTSRDTQRVREGRRGATVTVGQEGPWASSWAACPGQRSAGTEQCPRGSPGCQSERLVRGAAPTLRSSPRHAVGGLRRVGHRGKPLFLCFLVIVAGFVFIMFESAYVFAQL